MSETISIPKMFNDQKKTINGQFLKTEHKCIVINKMYS